MRIITRGIKNENHHKKFNYPPCIANKKSDPRLDACYYNDIHFRSDTFSVLER